MLAISVNVHKVFANCIDLAAKISRFTITDQIGIFDVKRSFEKIFVQNIIIKLSRKIISV